MDVLTTSMRPLAGGDSGETFLAELAGEQAVVRVYGGRSALRGQLAPEIDAAVLELVHGLLPVPEVLEVRRGDPDADLPGLLVTSLLPGERLDLLLPRLDADQRAHVGARLGTLLGRLGHMAQPRAGTFTDRTLVAHGLPEHLSELPAWVSWHQHALESSLAEAGVAALLAVAEDAQDLLDEDRRVCLVHSDLNTKNLLADPATLEVTAVLDWEFAHAGSPYADLGNLLRFDREAVFADSVMAAYRDFMPAAPHDLLDRARAVDLFSLIDLAARPDGSDAVKGSRALLAAISLAHDPQATPAKS